MAVDMIARMMAMGNGKIEKMRDTAIENPENGEVLKYDAEQGKWVNGTASGGGGTSDYTDLTNKPKINGVTLAGNKSLDDIGAADASEVDTLLSGKVDKVTGKGLSTEDYTTAEKTKLAAIEAGAEANVQADWNQADTTADDYIKNKPTIPTVNDAALTIQKNGTAVGTFSANAATAATINITVPVDAEDVDALPDTTKYGASLSLSIDSTTYVVTASLKDQDGNTLGAVQTIDLPLETVVVGGSYDNATKKVILTLRNGTTVDFSVADLVAGLQTEITSTNKLDADLVDDTTSAHKFVTAADKVAWNAKSDFSGSYNDLTNKPTIPAAQVNADWNAASGAARILNKPAIYTKTEVDAALDEKLNTADVDASLSGTSTNPVQNKTVQAPLAMLIDNGAKNLLKSTATSQTINGVTFSVNDDETITANGTATANVTFFVNTDISASILRSAKFTGCPPDGSSSTYQMMLEQNSAPYALIASDRGTGYDVSYTENINAQCYVQIKSGVTVNNLVFKPMICTAEDWAVSHKFVPYAPTNRELYEMILALQNAQNGG